jgi:hypothetical protein
LTILSLLSVSTNSRKACRPVAPWAGWMLLAALLLGAVASPIDAHAQVITTSPPHVVMPPWNAQQIFQPHPWPDLTDPDSKDLVAPEDTPVKTRVYPDYKARGIRAGDWMFDPSVTAGTLFDSNVYSAPSNPQSDLAARLGAAFDAHTLWDRHGLDLQLWAQSLLYAHHPGLNENDVSFRGTGHFDIDHATQLLGTFQAAYLHDQVGTLTSPTNAIEPTPYGFLSGDVTLRREFGRFTGSAGVRTDAYDYGQTLAQNGSIINQDARDGQIYTAYSRVDYALSDKTALFTAYEHNWRNLRGTPTESLSSYGDRVLAGIDVELTHLIKGEFAGGYQRQHFYSQQIGDISGPAWRAIVTWSPSRRMDVHFNYEQIVTEASDTSLTGIFAKAAIAGIDYELRPNVVLSTAAFYEKDDFKGEPRKDDVYGVDAQIKYLMNRVTSLSLHYRYTKRDSNIPADSFDKHEIGLGVTARF